MASNSKSVKLSAAWQEFWEDLFPETPDWRKTLKEWVSINLEHLGRDPFLVSRPPSGGVNSLWAESLSIEIETHGAAVSVGGRKFPLSPWFAQTLVETSSHWNEKHPIELMVRRRPEQDATSRALEEDSARLVRNVTLRAGGLVRKTVAAAMLDGKLFATGLSARDGASKRERVTIEQLRTMIDLDMQNGRIEFLPGVSVILNVEVTRNPDYNANKKKGGSFDVEDDVLVEEMHFLRRADPSLSVGKAAEKVLWKAERRNGASDESVIDRLRRAYGAKYPSRPRQ